MIHQRRTFTIVEEPSRDAYRALLREASRSCSCFSLVQHEEVPLDATGLSLLASLTPYLIQSARVSAWPGTVLYDSSAMLYTYSLSAESAHIISDTVDGLYDWLQPAWPEDIAFLRAADDPWLVTISHERDSYLVLSPTEHEAVLRGVPGLRTVNDAELNA